VWRRELEKAVRKKAREMRRKLEAKHSVVGTREKSALNEKQNVRLSVYWW
jgi:hypothetical protein